MTRLASSDSRGRRRRGGASGPRRPCLFREIRRRGPQFFLREGFCHPRHDLVVSISTFEVMQLFHEIIFLLTPDHRNGCISAYPVHAVAFVANTQLGAEFSIRARIWDDLSGFYRRGQRGHNDQNAENNPCTQELPPPVRCCRRIIAHKSGRRGILRETPLRTRKGHVAAYPAANRPSASRVEFRPFSWWTFWAAMSTRSNLKIASECAIKLRPSFNSKNLLNN